MLKLNILLVSSLCFIRLCCAADLITSLPVELPKCDDKNGIHFNFSHTGIQRVPSSFLPSATVTCISLEHNLIDSIDTGAFEEFSNLEYLNLQNNTFLKNSNILSNKYPALKTLILDETRSNKEPDYLRPFLEINVNVTTPNLQRLYLRSNGINSISISATVHLKELYLSNNKLENFDTKWSLPALIHLHLGGNSIRSINSGHDFNLEELVLDSNSIADLERVSLCRWSMDCKLTKFSVKSNHIRNVAAGTLKHLISLRYFDLSFNSLEYVAEDEFRHLKKIQTFLLNNNELEITPNFSGLEHLEYLLLNDNKIREMGQNVFLNLPQLKLLKLNNNMLHEISPGTFSEMPALEELNLSNNKLYTCADGWISQLTSLRTLHLNDNNFQDGERISLNGTYTELQYINLLNNPFKSLSVQSIMFLPPNTVIDLKSTNHVKKPRKSSYPFYEPVF